jgi:hypothetical protein
MTVGDLRKTLEHLPDEMSVVYAWTWLSPKDVCLGRRRGKGPVECLLLDGDISPKAKRFGNTVLWSEAENPNQG